MKKQVLITVLLLSAIFVNAQYGWVNKNQFSGNGILDAGVFVIDSMAYVVGGITSYSPFTITNKTWQYNPTTDTWTQKANYPYAMGSGAFFSINGYGYQVGGIDSTGYYNSNNYRYDPVANTWTLKAPFPEIGIGGGFYFVINDIAYVGAGARNSNEHGVVTGYAYNPATDTWRGIANYPGNPSISLCTFAIDSFGYAGMGGDGNNDYYTNMYRYNPRTNTWNQIPSFPGKARVANLSAFVVEGKAYVGTGETPLNGAGGYSLGDYYMYDPVANTWSTAPGLQGPPRYGANAFSFGDGAYLVGGYNPDGAHLYSFVDEFTKTGMPCYKGDTTHVLVNDTTYVSIGDTLYITISVGIAPNNIVNTLNVYANPAHSQLNINTGTYAAMSGYNIKIINPLGQTVFQNAVSQQLFTINISSWATGVYFMQVLDTTNAVVTIKEIVIQ